MHQQFIVINIILIYTNKNGMEKLVFFPLVVVAGLLFCTACKKKGIKEEKFYLN